MGKEAYDDYKRHLRDREANSQRYLVLTPSSVSDSDAEQAYLNAHANTRSVPSSSIRVGDLVLLEKDQRVPADMILLHTSEGSGTCFIRTDQLDGETVPECQKLNENRDLIGLDAEIYGEFVSLASPMIL
jgi:phospholipid-translocating ATPase